MLEYCYCEICGKRLIEYVEYEICNICRSKSRLVANSKRLKVIKDTIEKLNLEKIKILEEIDLAIK